MKKIYILITINLFIINCYPMANTKEETLSDSEIAKKVRRDLTLDYSSDIFSSTGEIFTPLVSPVTSPRTLEESSKKNCFLECLKKFYCCLWWRCGRKKSNKLVILYEPTEYNTIQ